MVRLALALGLSSFAFLAQAGSLQVTPIGFYLDESSKAQELWLSNPGQTPTPAQIRIQEWTQVNLKEELTATSDIVASPAQTTIPAAGQQLIRLARISKQPITQEKAYRILVDELPSGNPTTTTGLNLLLRYSVPIFVGPANGPQTTLKDLEVTLVAGENNTTLLNISNKGPTRVRLSEVTYETNGKQEILVPGLLGYVLSGSTMQWTLNATLKQLTPSNLRARLADNQEPQLLHAGTP